MNTEKIIGKNIQSKMIEKNVSLTELAQYIDVTRQTLTNYLKGTSTIDSVKLMKIAEYFSTPLDDFFFEQNDSKSYALLFRTSLNEEESKNSEGYSMNDYEDMTVHPYSIRLFKRRWYLIGYSEYSKGVRIYMLDRADDARMLGESFDMPEEFDAEAFFEEFNGVHPSRSEKVCVKVKFLASKRDLVRTIPLHSTQKETETTSSYSVFEYYLRPNFDFKQEILSYMDSAEVLEPVTLRRELASVLLDMYKLYRSDLIKA